MQLEKKRLENNQWDLREAALAAAILASGVWKIIAGLTKLWGDASPIPPWDFRRGKTAKAPGAPPPTTATGPIVDNRNSKIFHTPDCPDYSKVSERNRVTFKTEGEAQAVGYRKARSCP